MGDLIDRIPKGKDDSAPPEPENAFAYYQNLTESKRRAVNQYYLKKFNFFEPEEFAGRSVIKVKKKAKDAQKQKVQETESNTRYLNYMLDLSGVGRYQEKRIFELKKKVAFFFGKIFDELKNLDDDVKVTSKQKELSKMWNAHQIDAAKYMDLSSTKLLSAFVKEMIAVLIGDNKLCKVALKPLNKIIEDSAHQLKNKEVTFNDFFKQTIDTLIANSSERVQDALKEKNEFSAFSWDDYFFKAFTMASIRGIREATQEVKETLKNLSEDESDETKALLRDIFSDFELFAFAFAENSGINPDFRDSVKEVESYGPLTDREEFLLLVIQNFVTHDCNFYRKLPNGEPDTKRKTAALTKQKFLAKGYRLEETFKMNAYECFLGWRELRIGKQRSDRKGEDSFVEEEDGETKKKDENLIGGIWWWLSVEEREAFSQFSAANGIPDKRLKSLLLLLFQKKREDDQKELQKRQLQAGGATGQQQKDQVAGSNKPKRRVELQLVTKAAEVGENDKKHAAEMEKLFASKTDSEYDEIKMKLKEALPETFKTYQNGTLKFETVYEDFVRSQVVCFFDYLRLNRPRTYGYLKRRFISPTKSIENVFEEAIIHDANPSDKIDEKILDFIKKMTFRSDLNFRHFPFKEYLEEFKSLASYVAPKNERMNSHTDFRMETFFYYKSLDRIEAVFREAHMNETQSEEMFREGLMKRRGMVEALNNFSSGTGGISKLEYDSYTKGIFTQLKKEGGFQNQLHQQLDLLEDRGVFTGKEYDYLLSLYSNDLEGISDPANSRSHDKVNEFLLNGKLMEIATEKAVELISKDGTETITSDALIDYIVSHVRDVGFEQNTIELLEEDINQALPDNSEDFTHERITSIIQRFFIDFVQFHSFLSTKFEAKDKKPLFSIYRDYFQPFNNFGRPSFSRFVNELGFIKEEAELQHQWQRDVAIEGIKAFEIRRVFAEMVEEYKRLSSNREKKGRFGIAQAMKESIPLRMKVRFLREVMTRLVLRMETEGDDKWRENFTFDQFSSDPDRFEGEGIESEGVVAMEEPSDDETDENYVPQDSDEESSDDDDEGGEEEEEEEEEEGAYVAIKGKQGNSPKATTKRVVSSLNPLKLFPGEGSFHEEVDIASVKRHTDAMTNLIGFELTREMVYEVIVTFLRQELKTARERFLELERSRPKLLGFAEYDSQREELYQKFSPFSIHVQYETDLLVQALSGERKNYYKLAGCSEALIRELSQEADDDDEPRSEELTESEKRMKQAPVIYKKLKTALKFREFDLQKFIKNLDINGYDQNTEQQPLKSASNFPFVLKQLALFSSFQPLSAKKAK